MVAIVWRVATTWVVLALRLCSQRNVCFGMQHAYRLMKISIIDFRTGFHCVFVILVYSLSPSILFDILSSARFSVPIFC